MINDSLLDLLGEYFVSSSLYKQGWTFEQFVREYELGYITLHRDEMQWSRLL